MQLKTVIFSAKKLSKEFSTHAYYGTSTSSYDSNKYCIDMVKKFDHENYLVGLLFPQKFRNAYFAVRAFNIEIAQIKDQVSRNTFHAGKIRFQFWRDLLNSIHTNSDVHQQHPAANALKCAIKDNNLTLRWFERSLDARHVQYWSTHCIYYYFVLSDTRISLVNRWIQWMIWKPMPNAVIHQYCISFWRFWVCMTKMQSLLQVMLELVPV